MTHQSVEFSQVHKGFANQRLFEGLDLELPAQQVTALVGASGCGKSTLLQMINGLLQPDAGQVRVFGEPLDYRDLPRIRRKIGYAVQQIALFPHLTVAANIAVMARLEGWSEAAMAQRISKLFQFMYLDEALLERYPHEISGGQAQRVGLCRAMMLDPPLLLLDEAFSAVDPITRVDVHSRFQALQEAEARSVVLVTHDMQEALKLADYLVVLEPGRVLQAAVPEEVVRQPANEQVARLLEAR
ncbi:ATP-binding cassette domain-containing protein [Marinospirillum perlucidum]|uniref:ATP-binding cassette domain-containing protein n=1 Tax=Marinospirillum perlucidum TaxID=1982602 RepID=UPI000DF471E4|nr:ATP-binding cassette domain-containing protein [Marinospirillum perlucidum]